MNTNQETNVHRNSHICVEMKPVAFRPALLAPASEFFLGHGLIGTLSAFLTTLDSGMEFKASYGEPDGIKGKSNSVPTGRAFLTIVFAFCSPLRACFALLLRNDSRLRHIGALYLRFMLKKWNGEGLGEKR